MARSAQDGVEARAGEADTARLSAVGAGVVPIQAPTQDAAQTRCSNCGAAIAPDQRYCLACGQPVSPTRLAFLDVLQAESELHAPPPAYPPIGGYLPPLPPDDSAIGRLRRYSGLFGLIAVLLMCGLVGLLVGHWTAGSSTKTPATQVIKLEGSALQSAGSSTGASPGNSSNSSSGSSGSGASASKSAPAKEAQEAKEVKEAEKASAKPKPAVKATQNTLQKLGSSTGKQHQKEIEKLTEGDKPIETGG